MFPFAEPLVPEPISPELALVSPELAVIARAGLPDRPWEAFFHPVAEITPLRPPAVVGSLLVTPPSLVAPAEPPSASRRRPRIPVGLLLLAAFVGLVVAGSVLPVRDAPTLGPPPARANGLTTPTGPPATPQGPQVATTPGSAVVPAVPPPSTTTTTTATTTAPSA
jgi:hypothetical protein